MHTYQILYWFERISSLALIFCLGLIAGSAWENPPWVIVAFVMMGACLAKVWVAHHAKDDTESRR